MLLAGVAADPPLAAMVRHPTGDQPDQVIAEADDQAAIVADLVASLDRTYPAELTWERPAALAEERERSIVVTVSVAVHP